MTATVQLPDPSGVATIGTREQQCPACGTTVWVVPDAPNGKGEPIELDEPCPKKGCKNRFVAVIATD